MALAKLIPVFMPDILSGSRRPGSRIPGRRRGDQSTEFAPGKTFGTGTMTSIDYLVGLAEGRVAAAVESEHSERCSSSTGRGLPRSTSCSTRAGARRTGRRVFHRDPRRLSHAQRAIEVLGDDQRAAFKNWEEIEDIRNPLPSVRH